MEKMINWIINALTNIIAFIENAIRWLGNHPIITIIIIAIGVILIFVLRKILKK